MTNTTVEVLPDLHCLPPLLDGGEGDDRDDGNDDGAEDVVHSTKSTKDLLVMIDDATMKQKK
jgi:hypothetical protein